MAVERDEIPGFEDFYRPLTSREQTLPKLQVLRARLMTEVSDADLFEALADTFATLQTEDFEAGKVYGNGLVAEEWEATIEVWIKNEVDCLSCWRDPRAPRKEIFGISMYNEDDLEKSDLFDFSRDEGGDVSVSDRDKKPCELGPGMKEKILDACIACFPLNLKFLQ